MRMHIHNCDCTGHKQQYMHTVLSFVRHEGYIITIDLSLWCLTHKLNFSKFLVKFSALQVTRCLATNLSHLTMAHSTHDKASIHTCTLTCIQC